MFIRVIKGTAGNEFSWIVPGAKQELTSPVLHASVAPLVYVQIFRDNKEVASGYVGTGRHGGSEGFADFRELDASFANMTSFSDILLADRFKIGDSVVIESVRGDTPLDAGYWKRNLLHLE